VKRGLLLSCLLHRIVQEAIETNRTLPALNSQSCVIRKKMTDNSVAGNIKRSRGQMSKTVSFFSVRMFAACECVLMKSPAASHSSSPSSSSTATAAHPIAISSVGQRLHGTLTSPNFPRIYSAGINCILYTIVAGKSQLVEITFVEFDMAPPVKNR
jgi:CUB domain